MATSTDILGLVAYLKTLDRDERATFLLKYAAVYGRTWERDEFLYGKRRRRKAKVRDDQPSQEEVETLGQLIQKCPDEW